MSTQRSQRPAARQELNTVDERVVPIIFVPGLMGSRLDFGGQYEWDPDDWDGGARWALTSATTMALQLHQDQDATVMSRRPKPRSAARRGARQGMTNPENSDEVKAWEDQNRRGWAGVLLKYYGSILKSMEAAAFPAQCPVYACGYDWRLSNDESAQRLAQKIDECLEAEDALKCVIVTHSMGGLVTRAALNDSSLGLQDKVAGVVHTFQPVDGATVLYRRLHSGATWSDDGLAMRLLMGNKPWKIALLLSGMPGPVELLPTNNYFHSTDSGLNGWLNYPGAPQACGDIYESYLSNESPPGCFRSENTEELRKANESSRPWRELVPEDERIPAPAEVRKQLDTCIRSAQAFHTKLGRFKHANTTVIYGTKLETDVWFESDAKGEVVRHAPREGDGTVPALSGAALFEGQADAHDNIKGRQFMVSGAEHAEPFDQAVSELVCKCVSLVLERTAG